MKKSYELRGMSCGGCVKTVKQALLQVPDISEAEVHLDTQKVSLTMSKLVDVAELQSELSKAGHYKIKEISLNLT